MSINSLHIASTFMQSTRLQIEITSRNLSGAQDPNYSRQKTIVSNVGPADSRLSHNPDGLGVIVEGFERTRDGLLDQAFRTHHREAQGARSVDVLADRLESALGSASGLTVAAREVRLGLLEVANKPEDEALRQDLLQNIQSLTDRFQSSSQELDSLREESRQRTTESVSRFNDVLEELGDLNRRLPSRGKTSGKNALLDKRDALLDELSGMAEVRVVPQEGGAVSVYLEGRRLLFGDSAETVTLNANDQFETSEGVVLNTKEGALGKLRDFQETTIPDFQTQLDDLASQLVTELNSVHQLGYGLDGATGRDLLSGTDASDISLAIQSHESLGAAAARMSSTDRIGSPDFSFENSLLSQSGELNTAPSANGVVEINGVSVAWSDSDTLPDILDNLSAAGVVAEYDSATGKVNLQRDPTQPGPPDITVNDVSGNLSQVLGLDTAVSAPAIPGDGEVLRVLQQSMEGTVKLEDSFVGLQVGTGRFRRNAQDTAERAGLLESDARGRRDSVSAVSTDEELLALERYQQSFAAAARVANVADEILTNLINLGRN